MTHLSCGRAYPMLVIFCLHLVVTETGLLSPNMNMHLSVFLFNPCSLSLLFRVIMFFWWWSILYLETLLVSTSTLTFLKLHCFSYGYLYRYLFSCLLLSTFLLIGEGNGNPLQNSYLENSMDRGAWEAAVLGVTKSQTQLSAHTHSPHEK